MFHVFSNKFLQGKNISQAKSLPFVDALKKSDFKDQIEFHDVPDAELAVGNQNCEATLFELIGVHQYSFISAVLANREPDGYGKRTGENLKQVLNANNCFMTAARYATNTGAACVMAPVSGFHHAGPAYNGGFCTFNGLAAAAVTASKKGLKVTILDFDDHFGNGTDDCLKGKRIPSSKISHYTFGRDVDLSGGKRFVQDLYDCLRQHVDLFKPDLVLYQAGADSHTNDRLGSGLLTTAMMATRDRAVFSSCLENKVPVVWNLAGGYQDIDRVVELHMQTAKIAADVFKETTHVARVENSAKDAERWSRCA